MSISGTYFTKVNWGNFDTGVTLTLYDSLFTKNSCSQLLTAFFYILICYHIYFIINLFLVQMLSIPEVTRFVYFRCRDGSFFGDAKTLPFRYVTCWKCVVVCNSVDEDHTLILILTFICNVKFPDVVISIGVTLTQMSVLPQRFVILQFIVWMLSALIVFGFVIGKREFSLFVHIYV